MLSSRAELGRTPFAVLDTETTGVYPGGHDRIIEIAIVRLRPDTGEVEHEYVTLVNPGRDIGRADIHGITAGELLEAPPFSAIAGDVGRLLHGAILVGHNVRFDLDFLRAEYARLGVAFPRFPTLCTLQLAYRLERSPSRNLAACCCMAGVSHDHPHTALGDAHACLGLLGHYLTRAAGSPLCDLGCECEELPPPTWLPLLPSHRATPRSEAAALRAARHSYLSRLVAQLPGTEGSSAREAEYLCLLDQVLEDRALTPQEADSLHAAAKAWDMDQSAVTGAHQAFVWALARQANADGVVTPAERRDLDLVCELLNVDSDTLAAVLDTPRQTPETPSEHPAPTPNALAGKSVCFTGELLGKVRGERVTRDMAEDYARRAGMTVQPSVTKGLDLLVVADPDTQSGKAKKARQYGTRIMAEAVFWRAVGLNVE